MSNAMTSGKGFFPVNGAPYTPLECLSNVTEPTAVIKSLLHGTRGRLQRPAPFAAALALAACTTPGSPVGSATSAQSAAPAGALAALRREDVVWLQRLTFGLDSRTVGDYRRLGRERYLDQQLHPRDEALPEPVAAQLRALEVPQTDPAGKLEELHERRRSINAMSEGADQDQARKALNEEGNRLAYRAVRLQLLRALYSPAQLREQMVWFWLNHFSVHQHKADERWLLGDYEERAIRPHALGRFRDLVLATLEHPAMLEYLDNAQNAVGHVNENYARELMERHTLGVDGGYGQQDVQQLARVLTGVRIDTAAAPHLRRVAGLVCAPRRIRIQPGAARFRREDAPRAADRRRGLRRSRAGGDPHRAPAGLRALHLARARDLLRGRHPADRAHRCDGGHVPANRRRHRGDAPHAVP